MPSFDENIHVSLRDAATAYAHKAPGDSEQLRCKFMDRVVAAIWLNQFQEIFLDQNDDLLDIDQQSLLKLVQRDRAMPASVRWRGWSAPRFDDDDPIWREIAAVQYDRCHVGQEVFSRIVLMVEEFHVWLDLPENADLKGGNISPVEGAETWLIDRLNQWLAGQEAKPLRKATIDDMRDRFGLSRDNAVVIWRSATLKHAPSIRKGGASRGTSRRSPTQIVRPPRASRP